MAHVPHNSPPPNSQQAAGSAPPTANLVDQQIQRTRRSLKIVDASTGLIALTIGVLVYLLAVAALEHWVLAHGWSPAARSVLLGVLLLGVTWYGTRIFWPLLRRPINPAFAAQAIEHSSPSLKNSLLNLLLLRGQRQQLPQRVYHAIEQQAAQRLAQVPVDTGIDRSATLRLGYILVGVIALCTLYGIVSPKDPLTSVARILLPWSPIAVPSRVQISAITPGDTSLARGERLRIAAEILGLEPEETAQLVYTTRDQQQVDQRHLMTPPSDGFRYVSQLPHSLARGETAGIEQDLTYWIEAGDARSPRYQVTVFARPTLVVQKLRYNYPDYTGYPSREVQHTGDIRALVGTRVTLVATANKPIATAHVDFDADGRQDLRMEADGQQATVTFPLELDGRNPRYQNYVLRYQTTSGRHNRFPPQYQIDVIPDYAPEIQLLLPAESIREVTLQEEIEFQLEARDPDFAVQEVSLRGEVAGKQIVTERLLSQDHRGRFLGQLRKTPAELGLRVGDVLEYWGVAADNRRPTANVAATPRQRLRVVDPQQPTRGNQAADDPQQTPQPGENETQPAENPQPEQTAGAEGGAEGEEGAEADAAAGESGGAGQQGSSTESATENGAGGAGPSGSDQSGDAGGEPAAGGKSERSPDGSQDPDAGQTADDQRPPQPGDQSASAAERQEREQVSPAGDDDGTAFQRMAEHFDQHGSSDDLAHDGQAAGDPSRPDQSRDASEGQPRDGQTGEGHEERSQHGQSADGQSPDGQSPAGQAGDQRPDPTTTQSEDAAQDQQASDNTDASPADGARDQNPTQQDPSTAPTGTPTADQRPSNNATEEPADSPSGTAEDSISEPDTGGNTPGSSQGSAPSDGPQKPHDNTDAGAASQHNDPQAPGRDRGTSETSSRQGGDRSGAGAEGAGQPTAREGTGGAGTQQAADQGGGTEPGQGETGQQPGDQAADKNQPGSPNPRPATRDSQLDQPGSPNSRPATRNSQLDQAGDPASSTSRPSTNSGKASAAGSGGDSAPPPSGEIEPGDAANLDYARQQTDLVLERLEDQLQKNTVDQQLLDKLGWNQDELRKFVNRWKNLRAQAQAENPPAAAQQELDDALRSLGLSPRRRYGFQSKTATDQLRDLQDAYRGRTPLEYQERVRAYIKGTATAPAP